MNTHAPPLATGTLPAKVAWQPSDDDLELTLLVDGQRAGGVHRWADTKSGGPSFWTVVIAHGGDDLEVREIFDSGAEACTALLTGIAP